MRVDAHWDTALYLDKYSSLERVPEAHADYRRLREHVDIAFLAIYFAPAEFPLETRYEAFQKRVGLLKADLAGARIGLLQEAEQLQNAGKYVLIGAEGGEFLGDAATAARRLAESFALGLRLLGPTHNADTALAGGCMAAGGGLTELGREIVAQCNRLGVLVDGAHLAARSLADLLETTQKPITVSHTCCTALCPECWRRNLTDEQLKAVAEAGGVIGVTFVPDFLGGTRDLAQLVRQIRHAVAVAGIEHVGIGSDFDGAPLPADLTGLESLPLLWQALRQSGFSETEIEKISGNNFCRLLAEVLP